MMLSIFRQSVTQQYQAALSTLAMCLNKSPDREWHSMVSGLTFCQVFFHTLFFTDLYLAQNIEDMKSQSFHYENKTFFRDYEELEDRKREFKYDRAFVADYLDFCRAKSVEVMNSETEESLGKVVDFVWHNISRAEMHIYNIRHIQHHAAQLILKLRLGGETNLKWIKTGWVESNME